MAQQNINLGAFPDDPDADSIRIAFEKTQNNFTELYTTGLVAGVNFVNAGNGVSVNTTTGNVTVSANMYQVKVVSNSLLLGINTPYVGNTANYTSSVQTLNIDTNPNTLAANTFTGNPGLANLNGILTAAAAAQPNLTQAPNLVQIGNLTSLTVLGSITSANAFLGNIVVANYFAGNLLTPAQPNITSVGNLISLNVDNTITANHVVANTFTGVLVGPVQTVSNAAQPNITSVGTLIDLTVAGNITAGNADLGNTVVANYFSGNGTLLTNVSAITANTVSNSAQPNITSVGNLTALNVLGTLNFGAISANALVTSAAVNLVPNYKIPIDVKYPNGVSKTMYICLTDQP